MQSLVHTLLTQPFDREKFKYLVMGFLQKTHTEFDHRRVYPSLEVLGDTTEILSEIHGKMEVVDRSDLEWSGWTGKDYSLIYNKKEPSHEDMASLKEWLAESLPYLYSSWNHGKRLFRDFSDTLIVQPIGVRVLYNKEGILLTKVKGSDYVMGWVYSFGIQESAKRRNSTIRSKCLGNYRVTLTQGMMDIKNACMEKAGLKNSVVQAWLAEAETPLPQFHTIKPLALQKIVDSNL